MTLAPDRRLQVRIVSALALIVGVNGLVLAALAWSVHRGLSASGRTIAVDVGLSLLLGALLFCAVGLVAAQARYGSRTIVAGLDLEAADVDRRRSTDGVVRRLATQADVSIPSVAVADHTEPACLTVGTQRSPTVVVTTGLLDRLDDDELKAALAHEVAHLANRDLAVVTAVAAVVAVGDRILARERLLRRFLGSLSMIALISGVGLVVFALPILVIGTIYLVVSVIARTLLAVNAISLGLFSKAREHAADRGATQLTGDPAALASALETLEANRPTRDVRIDASATLGIVPTPLSFETRADDVDDEADDHWIERYFPPVTFVSDDPSGVDRILARLYAKLVAPVTSRVRRGFAWRPSTHPTPEARLARLRTLERDRHDQRGDR